MLLTQKGKIRVCATADQAFLNRSGDKQALQVQKGS